VLLIRNLIYLFAIDPAVKDVFLMRIDWPTTGSAAQNVDLHLRLAQRLRSIPEIKAVSASNIVPFDGVMAGRDMIPEGHEPQAGMTPVVTHNLVAPGYHELLGTPILQGRGFSDSDRAGSPPVAVINHAFPSLYFPDQRLPANRTSERRVADKSYSFSGHFPFDNLQGLQVPWSHL
jgi:hypothetical protein